MTQHKFKILIFLFLWKISWEFWLEIPFGRIVNFTILFLPIHDYGQSLHLLVCSLITFFYILEIFVVEVFFFPPWLDLFLKILFLFLCYCDWESFHNPFFSKLIIDIQDGYWFLQLHYFLSFHVVIFCPLFMLHK